MLDRPDLLRAAAILVLLAVFLGALAVTNRRPAQPIVESSPTVAAAPDDLSAELRRCNALGPQDAEDPRCMAVWEENRRRFFGRPARPLPSAVAPAISSSEGRR